ncbi:MAG: RDD family protein [Candidatus Nanopelagicales bacterium]
MSEPDPDPSLPSRGLTREEIGAVLSGPRSLRPLTKPDGRRWEFPGERLGLPEAGQASIARFGRRLTALLVDWLAALVLVRLFFPHLSYGSTESSSVTLAVFAVELIFFTWLAGVSFGQWLFGMQVVRLDGRPPGLGRIVVRTLLLCLAIPAMVWDQDSRGLHDRLAGTVLLRSR